jgi:hypothetical protein
LPGCSRMQQTGSSSHAYHLSWWFTSSLIVDSSSESTHHVNLHSSSSVCFTATLYKNPSSTYPPAQRTTSTDYRGIEGGTSCAPAAIHIGTKCRTTGTEDGEYIAQTLSCELHAILHASVLARMHPCQSSHS